MPWWVAIIVNLIEKFLTPELVVGLKRQLLVFLQTQAKKTETPLDDEAVKILATILGVEAPAEAFNKTYGRLVDEPYTPVAPPPPVDNTDVGADGFAHP